MQRKYLPAVIGLSMLLVLCCLLAVLGEWEQSKGAALAAGVIITFHLIHGLHGMMLRRVDHRYKSLVDAGTYCLAFASGLLFLLVLPIGVVALLLGVAAAAGVVVSCTKYALKHYIS